MSQKTKTFLETIKETLEECIEIIEHQHPEKQKKEVIHSLIKVLYEVQESVLSEERKENLKKMEENFASEEFIKHFRKLSGII